MSSIDGINSVTALFFHFLRNNLKVIVLLVAGSLLFGSITLANLLTNGIVLGTVIGSALIKNTIFDVVYS